VIGLYELLGSHDIAEILQKVALNTTKINQNCFKPYAPVSNKISNIRRELDRS
jgi:hypothetical protein